MKSIYLRIQVSPLELMASHWSTPSRSKVSGSPWPILSKVLYQSVMWNILKQDDGSLSWTIRTCSIYFFTNHSLDQQWRNQIALNKEGMAPSCHLRIEYPFHLWWKKHFIYLNLINISHAPYLPKGVIVSPAIWLSTIITCKGNNRIMHHICRFKGCQHCCYSLIHASHHGWGNQ